MQQLLELVLQNIVQSFSILATFFSVTGNVFIVLQKRIGFIIWILGNIVWIYVDWNSPNMKPQIIMMVVYAALNVWGFLLWTEKESHWGIQENVYCVDCKHEVDRGYRLLKSINYDRTRDRNPQYRCSEHSREYLKVLRLKGVIFSGFEGIEDQT